MMRFRDRAEAGRRLGARLVELGVTGVAGDVVVVGLPRGGVPVAAEVAAVLGAPLDVVVVRKLGAPMQPELALGAIGEGSARVLNHHVIEAFGVGEDELREIERRERAELERRARNLRGVIGGVPLRGRTVVVVDDGLATGATARAAVEVVRAAGARRVMLAVPVAPAHWAGAEVADRLVVLEAIDRFIAVGHHYVDFAQVTDDEVRACLAGRAGGSDSGRG